MRWESLFDDLETQLERELTAEELDLEAEEERLRLGRLSVRDRLIALHESLGGADYRLTLTLGPGERLVVHPVAFGRDWFSADVVSEGTAQRQCIVPLGAVTGVALGPDLVTASLAPASAPDGHPSLSARLGLTFAAGERLVVHPVAFGRDWFSADVVSEGIAPRQCIVPLGSVTGVAIDPGLVAPSLAPAAAADGHPSLSARLGLTFVLRDLCRRRRAIDLVLPAGALHGTIDRVGRDHLDLAVHDRGVARRASAVTEVRIVPLPALQLVRL